MQYEGNKNSYESKEIFVFHYSMKCYYIAMQKTVVASNYIYCPRGYDIRFLDGTQMIQKDVDVLMIHTDLVRCQIHKVSNSFTLSIKSLLKRHLTFESNIKKKGRVFRATFKNKKCFLDGDSFSIGHLNRVAAFLNQNEIKYIFYTDVPIPNLKSVIHKHRGIELRDYQIRALKKMSIFRRGIIDIATNGGKTALAQFAIMNHLKNHPKDKALLVCTQASILQQTLNRFKEFFFEYNIGTVIEGEMNSGDIIIALSQSLKKFKGKIKNVGLVIIDEVHGYSSEYGNFIIENFSNAKIFGLSGTPFDSSCVVKNETIRHRFGNSIENIENKELIERNISSNGKIVFLRINANDKKYRLDKRSFTNLESDFLLSNDFRNRVILNTALKEVKQRRKTIVMVRRIDHGEFLLALWNSKVPEYNATFLQGSDDLEKREEVIKRFKSDDIRLLIVTTIFDTGISVDEIDTVINAGAGTSKSKALQRLGRILRHREGKNFIFYDTWDLQSSIYHEQSKERKKIYEQEKCFAIEML